MIRVLVAAAAGLFVAGCQTTMLKSEPGPGKLSPGQTVLVDDGTCPAGQVKQVTGGNRSQGVSRKTECVTAPAS